MSALYLALSSFQMEAKWEACKGEAFGVRDANFRGLFPGGGLTSSLNSVNTHFLEEEA